MIFLYALLQNNDFIAESYLIHIIYPVVICKINNNLSIIIFINIIDYCIIVVDSDIDEYTKDIICSDKFPKYVDCQETLVELSFIKWVSGFRVECRRISSESNRMLYYGFLNFYNV